MNAKHVLTAAKAFAAAKGISLGAASARIFDDGKKLAALESGSDILTGRAERAMQFISDNWPDDHKWPRNVPRPAPTPAAKKARAA